MNICKRHNDFATTLDEHTNLNVIQSRFLHEIVDMEDQELIERSKTKCMVCYYGHSGRANLKKIVREELDKRLK